MKAATQPAKLRRFDLCDVGQVVESLSKLFAVPIVPPIERVKRKRGSDVEQRNYL
jgi:hypothetical protein